MRVLVVHTNKSVDDFSETQGSPTYLFEHYKTTFSLQELLGSIINFSIVFSRYLRRHTSKIFLSSHFEEDIK